MGVNEIRRRHRQGKYVLLACCALFVLLMLLATLQPVEACNEAVCGSIVSKCLLTQSCRCDRKNNNCSCCKDCYNCLAHLYSECCSCVGMCPMPNDTQMALNKQSQVGAYENPVIGLFEILTTDVKKGFTSISFPVDFDMYAPNKGIKYQLQSIEQDVLPIRANFTTLNCTVAYWNACRSWNKCYKDCEAVGATSFRWFHDGCCECIGKDCINYGLNQSRCTKCPDDDGYDDETDDLDVDYGQDEGDMDD